VKQYILFGAGEIGRSALKILGEDKVAFFCDNKRSGQVYEDKNVISFAKLKEIYKDYTVVLTAGKERALVEISFQMKEEKIPFVFFKEEAEKDIENDLKKYTALNRRTSFNYDAKRRYFIATDKACGNGSFSSYFWQDLWAAKHIYQCRPQVHYDIGSRVDGFIAHLAAFGQKVCLLDIRPMEQKIEGVDFIQCDATNLEHIEDESIESLSALCSLEHFGLGRYGDPIDPEACFHCFEAIQRKTAQGGRIYISVPVGKEHIEFNAHRVFFAETIVKSFSKMRLLEFSSVCREETDYNIDLHKYDQWDEFGGDRFGLFVFEKM